MCLGMVFDFEYRVVRYTKYSEPQSSEYLLPFAVTKISRVKRRWCLYKMNG